MFCLNNHKRVSRGGKECVTMENAGRFHDTLSSVKHAARMSHVHLSLCLCVCVCVCVCEREMERDRLWVYFRFYHKDVCERRVRVHVYNQISAFRTRLHGCARACVCVFLCG